MSTPITVRESALELIAKRGWPLPPSEMPLDVYIETLDATEKLITETDEPVENFLSEIQMRWLAETLVGSWHPVKENGEPRDFLVATDVGLYRGPKINPLAPDVMLSLDVGRPQEPQKLYRSYFIWMFGKAPELVIEIVSNDQGNEDTGKMEYYALAGVLYYVIHDPFQILSREPLRIFKLSGKTYERYDGAYLPEVGLGLKLCEGERGHVTSKYWLRWCDEQGQFIPDGGEQAERANQEAAHAAKLAAKLRELGIDPEQL